MRKNALVHATSLNRYEIMELILNVHPLLIDIVDEVCV